MSKYVSKYYTAEEIDQRLLQGYYDDVKAAGYTGSFQQFKNSLVVSGSILNCGTVESSSIVEQGTAVTKAGDPNVLFYIYKTRDGQIGIIKQIYKNDGNTIQYLTLNGVEYVRTINYTSGLKSSWKNINKASLVYKLHYDANSRTISFWDPLQDTAFGGIQLPLASEDNPGFMSSSDKVKLDELPNSSVLEDMLEGTDANSQGWKNSFRRLPDVTTFQELLEGVVVDGVKTKIGLNDMHGTTASGTQDYLGYFRVSVNGTPVEVFSIVEGYAKDRWSQVITTSRVLVNNLNMTETSYNTPEPSHKYRRYTYTQQFVTLNQYDEANIIKRYARNCNEGVWSEWREVGAHYTDSPNYGKRIAVFGGSFAQNMAVNSSDYKFDYKGQKINLLPYIADRLGATAFDDYAVGGQGMMAADKENGGKFHVPLLKQLQTAGGGYDIYIIMGGINDYGQHVPLGVSNGYADDTTYCGGLKKAIDWIKVANKNARIYTITPFKAYDNGKNNHGDRYWNPRTSKRNNDGHTFYEYIQAQKEVAQIHGVPCFDLWANQQFSGAQASEYYLSDYTHPNGKGYQAVADALVNFIAYGNGSGSVDLGLVLKSVDLDDTTDLNNYTTPGVYDLKGISVQGNHIPINNEGLVNARLTVLRTEETKDIKTVTQVLTLNNHNGGDGNIYIRSRQNSQWKPWAKLQTNVEVGQVNTLDHFIDNGIYSGVLTDGTPTSVGSYYDTFVLIVINNYTVSIPLEQVQGISQLKYSLSLDRGVSVKHRVRNNDGTWNDWQEIGGASLSEATTEVAGAVKLGKSNNGGWIAIGNIIDPSVGSGLGLLIDSSVFKTANSNNTLLGLELSNSSGLKIEKGLRINFGTTLNGSRHNAIPLCLGTPANWDKFGEFTGNKKHNEVPLIPVNPDQFRLGIDGLELVNPSSATKVTWDSSSNMNDFKTPGVYDIYGERTNLNDNLPILNSNSGHSISARLTVVASTLQPANNEICVTQFLMISNRLGGEGNMYIRTYNENNSPFMNGWSAWQKQQGMVETLINSNDTTVGQEIFTGAAQKVGEGLNGMIDNGMYSGIYIDNISYTGTNSIYYLSAPPTFVETFVLVVVNDYAASGQLGLQRHVTQLKYAVDAITGKSTVKKRVGTGSDSISWGDWTDIGGNTYLNPRDYIHVCYFAEIFPPGTYEFSGSLPHDGDVGTLWRYIHDDLTIGTETFNMKLTIPRGSNGYSTAIIIGNGIYDVLRFNPHSSTYGDLGIVSLLNGPVNS